ncbi:MAG: hypothetical protein WDN31_02440 [Hyphomicrobium sp.]
MRGYLLILAMACAPFPAHAQEYSRSVKLSKGKATVAFTPGQADAAPDHSIRNPRVGIAPSPSPSFGNFVARKLDDTGRAQVVPPSQMHVPQSLMTSGFEELMRSELAGAISAVCKQSRLDYVLLMGALQMSQKTDITAMIFFIGKMRVRKRSESRLYDCRSHQTVWVQHVLLKRRKGR